MQNTRADFTFPNLVKHNLVIQPALEPTGLRHFGLHRVVGKQSLIDMQIGRVQRLRSTVCRRHQHANLCKRHARLCGNVLSALRQRTLHIAQVCASMTRFILRDHVINRFDHWLGMPVGRATIPVV